MKDIKKITGTFYVLNRFFHDPILQKIGIKKEWIIAERIIKEEKVTNWLMNPVKKIKVVIAN